MTVPAIAVLVVEDEALVRLGVIDHLEDEGFVVFEAEDATAALILLETHPEIQVLFTDIDMPGSIDGLRLAAAVRDRWPPVKIVVTSGQRIAAAFEMPDGAVFVSKPYNPDAVARTFRSLAA